MRNWINLFEAAGMLNLPRGGTRTEVRTNAKALDNPEFVEWFKGSRVCDHEGNPLICYHGTFFEFTQFRHEDKGQGGAGNGFNRLGFWFDTDPGVPNWLAGYEEGYGPSGGIVYPCYLSIKNPFAMDSEWLWDADRDEIVQLKAELKPLSQMYYSCTTDDLGNVRTPDGELFDVAKYNKIKKQFDVVRKRIETEREDGFFRLMKALPRGTKSSTEEVAAFQADLIAEGYDGIWLGDTIADYSQRDYKASDWWLAFHPEQIKSIYSKSFTSSPRIDQ